MVIEFDQVLALVGLTKSVLPRLAKVRLDIETAEFQRFTASYAACPVAGVAHTQAVSIYNILVA